MNKDVQGLLKATECGYEQMRIILHGCTCADAQERREVTLVNDPEANRASDEIKEWYSCTTCHRVYSV